MSWWQERQARKNLEKMGLDKRQLKDMQTELKQGHKQAKQLRDELRKQESPTYRKLIKKMNDISYEPVSAEDRYRQSQAMVQEATLSEWERNDLLAQLEAIYGEVLKASPYTQILATLNHFKAADVTRVHKISISEELINNSDISEAEKEELLQQLKTIYKI